MSEPSREHVEAVACVVDPAAFRHVSQAWEAQRGVALLAAEAILTSTDPAVHAAMLDALVRAGALEVEGKTYDPSEATFIRYVSEWEAL